MCTKQWMTFKNTVLHERYATGAPGTKAVKTNFATFGKNSDVFNQISVRHRLFAYCNVNSCQT